MQSKLLTAGLVAAAAAAIVVVSTTNGPAATEQSPHTERPAAALTNVYPSDVGAIATWLQGPAVTRYLEGLAQSRPVRRGGGGCAAGDWECFKACTLQIESHGSYGAVSRNGTYRGAWQFDQRTWDANAAASGRTDLVGQDPAGASPAAQDQVAQDTYSRRGKSPWGGRC